MSAETPRPRVALHSGVLPHVPADVRAALDILELRAGADYEHHDLSEVRFLAAEPRNRSVAEQLPRLSRLEVFQASSAGTDWIAERLPAQATLCSARGARDAPVAEWVAGALLGTSSRLLDRAGARAWADLELADLADWTVLIIGMGSIGHRVREVLAPFGPRVIGVASRAREDLHGIDELPALLPEADAVVLLTPLTEDTQHLISASQLAAMKDGALLINAARGAVLDTDALLAELATGRLRAVLDVTDPEPLPEGHPLWTAPGLLAITPHIAGASPAGHRAAAQLAADQLGRWVRGEPLLNVVLSPRR